MRKSLEQIEEIINTLKVGDNITVLAPNGTMHAGAARFYQRKGIYNGIEINKYGSEVMTILVGKNKKKYSFRLEKDYNMVNGERIYKDYCFDILDIIKN